MNDARINRYTELFGTLKSTPHVCILALDGEVESTLNIKNRELDIKMVLEFAKNLISMEEDFYLDDMQKLFFT
ncbi:hypothetical protein [Flavivirga rizhaonensis]|uniref:Uncharacterized protein n=1 Tax=Flavivirga rizhaonensis TaxID=2559571 RepID=A0A4S1DZE6_9FLAO|nr:hypothetical protein [Flavivirga rizhaonensis]TGV03617.1 hypothetical protein EM932_06215 [Flavivirga rizhaonensis]